MQTEQSVELITFDEEPVDPVLGICSNQSSADRGALTPIRRSCLLCQPFLQWKANGYSGPAIQPGKLSVRLPAGLRQSARPVTRRSREVVGAALTIDLRRRASRFDCGIITRRTSRTNVSEIGPEWLVGDGRQRLEDHVPGRWADTRHFQPRQRRDLIRSSSKVPPPPCSGWGIVPRSLQGVCPVSSEPVVRIDPAMTFRYIEGRAHESKIGQRCRNNCTWVVVLKPRRQTRSHCWN